MICSGNGSVVMEGVRSVVVVVVAAVVEVMVQEAVVAHIGEQRASSVT